ncbi:putative acetyltransferase YvcN [Orchesella cincta]|uniref:arylamine N-acetyltransferase n=1 Tax=Orchesella cincta TaxID=48709 RepID=A0A1D2N8H0_ORCCI|nr:putative acetyltransferase YvcN [Orchesella cincta]
MLSYEQAVYFLESVLGMPHTWRELLYNKPLEFLTLYMKRHAVRLPFQNIEMAAVDPDQRWFPSESDVVSIGLAGKGGCCIHLNYFTKLVFQSIGLNSFAVRGDHYQAPVAGTHCLVMVSLEGPNAHGIYMVEVGGAYPILEPIPMQRLPYRTLQAGGFPYEFRLIAPGWIGKFHLGGGLMGGKFADKGEVLRTSWDLKPRSFWEFDYPMLETFTKPCYSALLKNPMMYRFFTNKEFRKLFPELPENMNGETKEKVLITNRKALSKIGKALAANGKTSNGSTGKVPTVNNAINPKTPVPAKVTETNAVNNSKVKAPLASNKEKTSTTNGKPIQATILTSEKSKTLPASSALNGKGQSTVKTLIPSTTNGKTLTKDVESEEDEYEVVTEEEEEEESEEEDVMEDPKNFIFVWKRRVVVGDANSRKVVKNYKSYEELAGDLKKYFPRIPKDAVDKAAKVFSEYEPIPTAYDAIL